uniref:Uncharacterized protein n=1 Tax=Anguilla anguilla TaxID=7936 RepID=A0A0E9QN47_ANGAN
MFFLSSYNRILQILFLLSQSLLDSLSLSFSAYKVCIHTYAYIMLRILFSRLNNHLEIN